MSAGRLVVLAVVVAFVAVAALTAARLRARRRAAGRRPPASDEPALEAELVAGAPRTWVVFTSKWCSRCGPLADRLRRDDPTARVVLLDVADRPDLARRHRVRSAPTVLLAGPDGRVTERHVGEVPTRGELRAAQVVAGPA